MLTTLLLAGLLDAPSPAPTQTGSVVTLARAKRHLKVDADEDDDLIADYLAAAIETLDGPTGWLGRAIQPQTIKLRFNRFDQVPESLPYPPLIAVLAVEQMVDQAWTAVPYRIDDGLLLPPAAGWPSRLGPIRVTYRAGMDGQEGRTLPFPILSAILLMVGDLYRFRETVVVNGRSEPVAMSTTVDDLLTPMRLY